jgi:hypothetical protein
MSRSRAHRVAAIVVGTVLSAAAAQATPTIETFASLHTTSATLDDHDGPQLGGVPPLTSSATHSSAGARCTSTDSCGSGNQNANATATQFDTPLGTFSALQVDAEFFSGTSNLISAKTTWQESPLGAGPNSIDLFIKPGELTIIDFASITFSHATTARYRIELSVNGNVVFFSEAVLSGGTGGLTLTEAGTDLGGALFSDPDFPENIRGYRFDSLFTTIDLGNLSPSDVVRYTMEVSVTGPGLETGGFAHIGDPFDLSGGGSGVSFSVPEPSAALLLSLGIGGLAALGRAPRRA